MKAASSLRHLKSSSTDIPTSGARRIARLSARSGGLNFPAWCEAVHTPTRASWLKMRFPVDDTSRGERNRLAMERSAHLENWNASYVVAIPSGREQVAHRASFEETYPRYEFAEMVRIGLAIGEWLMRVRRRIQRRRRDLSAGPSPGEIHPAE